MATVQKLFFIFLVIIMPLQATWAAAADYCKPGKEVTAKHFGHHEHEHEHQHAQLGQSSDDDAAGSSTTDCLNCHGSYSGMVVSTFGAPPIGAVASPLANPTSRLLSTSSSRPEKPKWFSAV